MAVSTVARATRGSLIIYEQTDIQTPATAGANGLKAHLISSTIALDQPLQDSKVINATRNPTDPYSSGAEVKGGFTIQADPISIGYYLKWLLGAPTTTGAGPYVHVFKLNATSPLLALTIDRLAADITQCWTANGVKLNKFSFSMSRGSCLEIPFDVIGLGETRSVAAIDAAPFEPNKVKFLAGTIAMQEAGVAFALCKKFDGAFDNQMVGLDVLGNSNQYYDIIEGIGMPTGTFDMYIKDGALYDKAKNVTESSLKLTFTATDATSTLEMFWPEVKFMAFSPANPGGTGAIPVSVAFKPYSDNATEATALQVTLTNAHPSYATIPA